VQVVTHTVEIMEWATLQRCCAQAAASLAGGASCRCICLPHCGDGGFEHIRPVGPVGASLQRQGKPTAEGRVYSNGVGSGSGSSVHRAGGQGADGAGLRSSSHTVKIPVQQQYSRPPGSTRRRAP
jgi:hypothetical protein